MPASKLPRDRDRWRISPVLDPGAMEQGSTVRKPPNIKKSEGQSAVTEELQELEC